MDKEKLIALRAQYEDKNIADNVMPHFQKVASDAGMSSEQDIRSKPYSGISSFLDLPISDSLTSLDVAFVGVPSDLAVSNRGGARFGPRAIREVERIGPYNHYLDMVPASLCNAADIGDVPFQSRYDLPQTMEDIELFYKRLKKHGVIPISVGGDHSITYPILRALGQDQSLALIHIDAHCDTAGSYDGSKYHHGGPFRLATLDGVIDPEKTIQIGIRGSSETIWEFSYTSGMTVVHIEEFWKQGVDAMVQKTRALVGDAPVYLTVDIDGFDPAFAPGTGTPEVGGITSREGLAFLRGLLGLNFVGADVVEVAPMYDPTTNTSQLGAQILFEEFCLIAETISRTQKD